MNIILPDASHRHITPHISISALQTITNASIHPHKKHASTPPPSVHPPPTAIVTAASSSRPTLTARPAGTSSMQRRTLACGVACTARGAGHGRGATPASGSRAGPRAGEQPLATDPTAQLNLCTDPASGSEPATHWVQRGGQSEPTLRGCPAVRGDIRRPTSYHNERRASNARRA